MTPDFVKHNPVANVIWVPIEKVQANNYNPNSVATTEMKLLYLSIKNDFFTQPIVTIYDQAIDKYVIIDGFHRYSIMRAFKDIYDMNQGLLPIVVLKKDISDRMASTVRHNRARGKHSVQGMSNIVFNMLQKGWSDARVCNELGMQIDELVRLKHITGFAKLFKDVKFSRAWESEQQIKIKKEFANGNSQKED